ncbi:MAG: zinc ribbon domain-containing protein [Clostridia bacterium]|nr:zinc ribbon domain-containing protein [Clostridia bacterium]
MPLYSVQCDDCSHRFEELAAVGRDKSIRCPKCGGTTHRVYQGSCSFGAMGAKVQRSGGHVCNGSCSCCSGCRS